MYASNGSIPEIRVDERCKSYWKANMKDQNSSAVDSQSELKSRIQGKKTAHPKKEGEKSSFKRIFLDLFRSKAWQSAFDPKGIKRSAKGMQTRN